MIFQSRSFVCMTTAAVLTTVSGCGGFRSTARSRVLLGTVAGPVGGLINVIEVSRTYRATPEQESEALKLAELAVAKFSAKTRKKMKKNGTSLVSVPVTPAVGSTAPASVMVIDVEKREAVSDQVFELEEKPEEDEFAEFSNYFTLFTQPLSAEEMKKLEQADKTRKERVKKVEADTTRSTSEPAEVPVEN